jgi:hypothetical protein
MGLGVAHVEKQRVAAAQYVPRGGDIYFAKAFRLRHDPSSCP